MVDAVVHVLAWSNADRHRRTGSHRPIERVSVYIFYVTIKTTVDILLT